MDWLKRNWVDVLMAGLILTVVGGFLTLLLRGGVFVSKNPTDIGLNSNKPTVTTVPAPTSQPDVPATAQSDTPTVIQTPSTQTSSPKPSTTNTPQTTPLDVPEIPEAPRASVSTTSKNAATASTQSIATSSIIATNSNPNPTPPITPTQTTSAKNTPTQNTSASTTNSETTANNYVRADFLRNYRIATGSYSSLERADKAVRQLKTQGLPAQSFPSGNTYVVVVGPYAREASARTALTRIKKAFPDAVLYRPDGTREATARVVTPQPSPKPSGGGTSTPATFNTDASAYLQIGAFKDSKSAATLLTKLKDAGFKPLTKSSSGLLRVLVGPFTNEEIKSTRSELKNQGFEAFPINL
jgi:cell division protein FtsN